MIFRFFLYFTFFSLFQNISSLIHITDMCPSFKYYIKISVKLKSRTSIQLSYPACAMLEKWKDSLSSWPSSTISGMFSTSSVRDKCLSSSSNSCSFKPITGADTFLSSLDNRCGRRGDRPGLYLGEGTIKRNYMYLKFNI